MQVVSFLTTHVYFVQWVMMLVSYRELQQPLHGCAWDSSCCHSSQIGVEPTEIDFVATLPFPHLWSDISLVQHEVYCNTCHLGFDKACTALIPSQPSATPFGLGDPELVS